VAEVNFIDAGILLQLIV